MKVLKATDHVSIIFGEWFDKTYGNTYYDATVHINDQTFEIPYKYGYNAGDAQSVEEAITAAGFRIRNYKDHTARNKAYNRIRTYCIPKLKRDLIKVPN